MSARVLAKISQTEPWGGWPEDHDLIGEMQRMQEIHDAIERKIAQITSHRASIILSRWCEEQSERFIYLGAKALKAEPKQ